MSVQRLARRLLAAAETHSALIRRYKPSTARSRVREAVLLSDSTLDVRQYFEGLVSNAVASGQQAEDVTFISEVPRANRKARLSIAVFAGVGAVGLLVGIAGYNANRSAGPGVSEAHDEVNAVRDLKPGIAAIQQQRNVEAAALARQTIDREIERDALQRQIVDLRRQANQLRDQITQRSRELETARTDLLKPDQQVEALDVPVPPVQSKPIGDQQGREEPQQLVVGRADQANPSYDQIKQRSSHLQSASIEAANSPRQKLAASSQPEEKPRQQKQAPKRAPHETAAPSSEPPQAQPASMPEPGPVAAQQLLMARQSLVTGRPNEARRLLTMVQMQMVYQPVERLQHDPKDVNVATGVGDAIRSLDMGANGQATQALDQAVYNAGDNGERQ
jgi:hypothetical protein